jgi:hypothetical protein
MTFNEKLTVLIAVLMEKAEELSLAPYECEAKYTGQSTQVYQINVRFTDAELLKQQHRNGSIR